MNLWTANLQGQIAFVVPEPLLASSCAQKSSLYVLNSLQAVERRMVVRVDEGKGSVAPGSRCG